MAMGRYSDAQLHLARLIAAAPQDPQLLTILGQCQSGQGQFDQGEATFREVIRVAPDRTEAYDLLSRLLRDHLSRPSEALELLDKLVARGGQSVAAYVVRSNYHLHGGALPEAEQDMGRALALEPDGAATLLAAAEFAESQDRWDRARSYLAHGLEAHPLNSAIQLAAIDLESRCGDPRAALSLANRALRALPNHPELLWNKADLLIETGENEQAELVVEQLARGWYPPAALCYLKGRVLANRRQWMAAAGQFRLARENRVLTPVLLRQAGYRLGRCHEMVGELDLALAAYREVVAVSPDWLPARLSLAEALAAAGHHDEAIENYHQITHLKDGQPEIWLTLVRSLIVRNLAEPEGTRDWDEVEEALDGARRAASDPTETVVLQAEMLLARGRAADAAELLTGVRDASPQNAQVWAAMVNLAVRQSDWGTAADLLAAAETQCGDRVELRLAQGQFIAAANSAAPGRSLSELEQSLDDFTVEEQQQLLRGLGTIHFSLGQTRNAARLWSVVAKHRPDEVAIRLFLLDAVRHNGSQVEFEQVLSDIGRIEGPIHGVFGRYTQAVRLISTARDGDSSSLQLARGLLNEATIHRPLWSRIPLLLAEIDEREGNLPSAIENLRQGIDLGDRTPSVVRRSVELLYRENRFVEADQVLRTFDEQSVPFSTELRSWVATAALRAVDHSRTADLAERMAAEAEQSADYIWLGQILTRLRRDDQAEVAFRKAIELDDSNDVAWVAWTRFLRLTGQMQRIDSAIAEATARIPAASRSLALARCFEASEQFAKAEQQYELARHDADADSSALVQGAGFYLRVGQPKQAEPLLRKLLKTAGSDPRQIAWARRSLALILAVAGDYASFQQALELIEQNLKVSYASDEDRRDKARVLATRNSGKNRREALAILSGLQRHAAGSNDDRLLRAELFRAEGQWPRARREMQVLLATAATPRAITVYLEGLLDSGELEEADHWVQRLEQFEPDSSRTLRLRARLRVLEGKTSDAIHVVDSYVRDAIDPATRLERLACAAGLFEELSNQARLPRAVKDLLAAEAEVAYRNWAAVDPVARLRQTQFLARHGQIAAALELFEQSADSADSRLISATAEALTASHPLTLPQLSQIRHVLDRAVERENAAVLFVSQANVASLAGDYPLAETLYHRAIDIDPRQISALNELAIVRSLSDGQHAEALRLVEQAMDVSGPDAESLDVRAIVEIAAGDRLAAKSDLKEALDVQPLASAYFHLAQLLAAEGDAKSAKVALEQGHAHGLSLHGLHPLEQRAYQQLTHELKGWSGLGGHE
jgi:tetratricopeptide (TPR) repeat protein